MGLTRSHLYDSQPAGLNDPIDYVQGLGAGRCFRPRNSYPWAPKTLCRYANIRDGDNEPNLNYLIVNTLNATQARIKWRFGHYQYPLLVYSTSPIQYNVGSSYQYAYPPEQSCLVGD